MNNLNVHSLWIGSKLSKLELLTIHSFINQGHHFNLWVYGPINIEEREGLFIRDANEILNEGYIFSYKHSNTFGHGKGSYAGFSDIFRYKLLYKLGGWWVDMDIYCLKAFDFSSPYFFRSHHELLMVGNVMKCPPKSDLMLHCYQEAVLAVNEENTNWHLPIQILVDQVIQLKLEHYIVEDVSNHDKWEQTKKYIYKNPKIPKQWYFIHWQNEEWRNRGLDKNIPRIISCLGKAMQEHQILSKHASTVQVIKNYIQTI